ncbi:alternative ribosome rescue aminoacyl-tRNA hydrolase ArfB [Pseudochryseolinea flava]|uniref:Aminoacyl-tRNA hydrolase n=1 Tax=Pseudochryseolinea flava TaxID=2059302 RepID=A0A364Y1X7_9BACT|nr:alternative ribosome rescue aminoacyl-tRNA hydrolase ArfB [Pseudochryseolinea flava]RAW00097.1 aminoacyl-tRNA hydrolase [Pseudochryseolinea flava]
MSSQNRPITVDLVMPEIDYSTSRSSGPGGQNVNKVNTKVTLKFDVKQSQLLTEEERAVIVEKLHSKITVEGVLVLVSQEKRSQLENKLNVNAKFNLLMHKAFEKKKLRKATKPSKSAVKERIKSKKQHSEKKKWRQKPE